MSAYQRCGGVNRWGWAQGLGRATAATALALVCVVAGGCAQQLYRPPAAVPATAGTANVRIWTDRLTLPTRQVRPDPVPRFQATDGRKFYPYPAQTDLADAPQDHPWTVICMENRYLLVQVMPELGGRVFRIYDKLAGQDMLYRQTSINPAMSAIRGAWVAGGIEFNFPDCHSATTHDEVHWTTREYPDGSMSVLIGDVERISRMGWTVELRLAPDRACLEDRVHLINRTPIRQRCFYWTNAAVEGTEQVQMILPTPKVVVGTRDILLDWPLRGGVDYSWVKAYDGGTGILGVGGDEDFVAAYDHGRQVGLVHYADSAVLPARKFWTWGIGRQSRSWAQRAGDGGKPYLEMQAGPRVTISELAWMQPYEVVQFEECWIPVSRIGPVARANPQAAVRLTVGQDQTKTAADTAAPIRTRPATIGVLTTQQIPDAQVELLAGRKVLWRGQVDLSPETPLVQTVPVEADEVDDLQMIVRDAAGRVIIEHAYGQYARQDPVPKDVPNLQARRVDPSTPQGAVQRFELSWMDCRYTDAARTIEQALQEWPTDVSVCYEAGLLRLWQGRADEAAALLRPTSQRADTIGLQARYYLALADMQLGDLQTASTLLAQVQKIDPKASDSRVWKRAGSILHAKVLLSAGQFREAHNLLQTVLRVDTDDPYVAALSVYALRKAGRVEAAQRIARRYLAQPDLEPMARMEVQLVTRQPDPTLERMLLRDPEVSIELACDYISICDYSTAESILTGGAGQNVTSAMTWLLAGYCAQVMGRQDAAAGYRAKAEAAPACLVFPSRIEELRAAEQALKADPRAARASWYAGLVLMRLMRYDEAIDRWQQAVAIRDDNAVARRCLGVALARVRQQPEQAVAHLERAVQLAPAAATFRLDLAQAYAGAGRSTDQRDVLERALNNGPPTDRLLDALAEAYLATGQYRQAAETLDRGDSSSGDLDDGISTTRTIAWLGVGLQSIVNNDPRGALAAFDRAVPPPPASPDEALEQPEGLAMILYWRAVALNAVGRPEQAQECLKSAAAQAPAGRQTWRGYYGVLNGVHAALAMKALGQTEAFARQVDRLNEQPQQRRRWRAGGEWFRAYLAFRAAWGRALREGQSFDAAGFAKVAEDPGVPGMWQKLSVLAAEALHECALPAPETRWSFSAPATQSAAQDR